MPYPTVPYHQPMASVGVLDGILGVFLGFMLFFLMLCLAVAAVFYVLQAIAVFTIAKRRCIRKAWMAWIPVGSEWILGSISDQYQYVCKAKVTNRRKILMLTSLGTLVASLLWEMIVNIMIIAGSMNSTRGVGVYVMLWLLMYGIMIALLVIQQVFWYRSLYDLYVSCEPACAVRNLLLSIFLAAAPILLFCYRHKDDGMPPRREPAPQQPTQPVAELTSPSVPEESAETENPVQDADPQTETAEPETPVAAAEQQTENEEE